MGIQGKGERSSICKEGCAMTSVAMGMAGRGITLEGEPVRPDTLNTWLQQNKGYVCLAGDCNNLVLAAPTRVPGARLTLLGENPKPSFQELARAVTNHDSMYIGEWCHLVMLFVCGVAVASAVK
jgi:hypothetical protein